MATFTFYVKGNGGGMTTFPYNYDEMTNLSILSKREGGGDGMATSPTKGKEDGMVASTFYVKGNDDGRATSPFFL